MATNPGTEPVVSVELVARLKTEPANVADQLRAMAGLSKDARKMHRFDEYLIAAADILAARPSQPPVTDVERAEAIAVLQHWLARQPGYTGDDPRAVHYRRNRAALETAIAAMQSNGE